MNDNYTKRMMLVFVLIFGFMIAAMYLLPKNNQPQAPIQNTATNIVAAPNQPVNANSASQDELTYNLKKNIGYSSEGRATTLTLSNSNIMAVTIDTYGARINEIVINGKWNKKKHAISVLNPGLDFHTGDLAPGIMEAIQTVTNRPVFGIKSVSSNSVVLSSIVNYKGSPIRVTKTFTVSSNYQFREDIEFRNLSALPVKVDFNGTSFSTVSSFEFFTKDMVNGSNPLMEKYYDGNEIRDGINGGFMKAKDRVSIAKNPKWLSLEDNYFIAIMKPEFSGWTGKYILTRDEKSYNQVAFGAELPALFLEKDESKKFSVSFYAGPKKENIVTSIDKSYGKIFEWFFLFNWLMKPIEWGISLLMDFFSLFISNGGIVIIVLALVIKLILSPLSIKAAVSVKRTNLLQPKIKQLQEKYKDDSKTLNEKMAELYKKEGVNPLGGCLPMLFQIPVFFALYRVLSTSVELKGAAFLWIKDLTQPDTLFTMSIPFLPSQFNLLPIVMTAISILQMRLTALKGMANQQQNAMNTYLMPLIFLFLFWSMPSGLVLYWTIQNIYTIIEQEFINIDRKVKLI